MPDNYISRIKLSNGSYVLIKDAKAQSDISTLLGSHVLGALGAAAWEPMAASISGTGVASASLVKDYVDSQIGSITGFDVVVCAAVASEIPLGATYKSGATTIVGTMPGSDSTMYKIYLVADDTIQDGAYAEYITIRSGTEGSYTYTWEKIGSTAADFADYVKKTTKVAGIDLQDDITVSELRVNLGLAGFAYADTGSGVVSTIDSLTFDPITVSGSITISSATATATLTTADYQPSGSVEGEISAPTISLTKSTVTYVDGLNKGSAVSAAVEGVVVSLGTATVPPVEPTDPWNDYETLIFTAASVSNVMDYDAAVTTATLDNVTAASADAPTFSGTFTGATVTDALVTGVIYDRAAGNSSFDQTITPTVQTYNRTDKTITVVPNVTTTTTVTAPTPVDGN